MQHLKQPNRWSCLPTSFAMAAGISLEKILEIIGHDGSAMLHPDLVEPLCRRAFHIQECVWAVHSLGFAVTPFERSPQLAATEKHWITIDHKFDFEILFNGWGVITGETAWGKRHAVAYSASQIYDPNGQQHDVLSWLPDFNINTWWSFDLI